MECFPWERDSQWTRRAIISALCSINGSKPKRIAVLVEEIIYRFDGASGGAPVWNVKTSDVVETMYVSENREKSLLRIND